MIAESCFYLLAVLITLASARLFAGPKLADRVVAADLSGILFLGLIILFVHTSGETLYLDVAVVLALVTFMGTVAFARFLEKAPRAKKGKTP
ncbi:MAG TPA: monovalent cation/H+ antiporter complex subunit F [Bdellovibrionota bacterium]|jgi:multicomponent Na+:H+ antiporter subunit F|nr:monovalent cation/H+ antiporter complex subunit F [Bdellovibrionota bacterium]